MAVAQLVERSLPIPEVRGSNPIIRKIYFFLLNICLLSTVYRKGKNKEKEAGDGRFFKKVVLALITVLLRIFMNLELLKLANF